MLRMPKGLLFPTLVPQNDTVLKNEAHTSIFKLDWTAIESVKEKRWRETLNANPSPIKYCGTLPESRLLWLDSMQYAINEAYIQEIRSSCFKALIEWDREKKVSVNTLKNPAIEYIKSAFHLLADCLYDPATNYYSRTGDKNMAPYALLYRFWCYQCDYRVIEDRIGKETFTEHLTDDFMLLLLDLHAHLKLLEENHVNMAKKEQAHTSERDPKSQKCRSYSVHQYGLKGTIKDIMTNVKGSVTIPSTHINLVSRPPYVGMKTKTISLNLINPVLKRTKGEILLMTEIPDCEIKSIEDSGQNFLQFSLSDQKQTYYVKDATLKSLSATPPPVITISIKGISTKEFPYEDKKVADINAEKIKENCKEE